MSTLTITSAGDTYRWSRSLGLDFAGLEARQIRRVAALAAACLAAIVLAGALVNGYESSRPQPDLVTFAFRV
jgi:hypothetical protein